MEPLLIQLNSDGQIKGVEGIGNTSGAGKLIGDGKKA
jgi:hypothetical protein